MTSKDSDSDDSGVDENDKGKLITQFTVIYRGIKNPNLQN